MTVDPSKFARDSLSQLKKGSGGRVAGSRNKLSHAFLDDALDAWVEYGKASLKIVFHEKPDVFLKVMASIIPRELIMTDGKIDTISEDDLDSALEAVRKYREAQKAHYDS